MELNFQRELNWEIFLESSDWFERCQGSLVLHKHLCDQMCLFMGRLCFEQCVQYIQDVQKVNVMLWKAESPNDGPGSLNVTFVTKLQFSRCWHIYAFIEKSTRPDSFSVCQIRTRALEYRILHLWHSKSDQGYKRVGVNHKSGNNSVILWLLVYYELVYISIYYLFFLLKTN